MEFVSLGPFSFNTFEKKEKKNKKRKKNLNGTAEQYQETRD